MKSKKVILSCLVVFFITLLAVVVPSIHADTEEQPITTEEGFEVDEVEIAKKDVISTEDYILKNINKQYANNEKLEPADIITVKQTLAEDAKLPAEKTINSMWNEYGDAFIIMNEAYILMYNTDDNSDYYVAYVDTMHNDENSKVVDYTFAYANTNAELINDAIFDNETGLAYIPKKYTEENKNGEGLMNVQLQLLQACNSSTPTRKIDVKIDAENISGKVATSGEAEVSDTKSAIGIPVALNDKAKANITSDKILVYVNGTLSHSYSYHEAEGVLTLEVPATNIETVEISISDENIKVNQEYENSQIMPMDLDPNITSDLSEMRDFGTTWTVSALPQVGATIYINNAEVEYLDETTGRHDETFDKNVYAFISPGVVSVSENDMKEMVRRIVNGGTMDRVGNVKSFMQYRAHVPTISVQDSNGVTYTMPDVNYVLKCAHAESFATHTKLTDNRLMIRVFDVSQDHIVVGIVTATTHNQTGTAVLRIPIVGIELNGNLQIEKKDSYGTYREGATFHIEGPGGSWDVTTGPDGKYQLNDIKAGDYTITETTAPDKMINEEAGRTTTVRVEQGSQTTYTRTNGYPRGSVRLVKYDSENRGNTKGDAKLEGTTFKLVAANDIYEGSTRIYSAGQTVQENIVADRDGNTPAVTNLPVGNYYYEETKAGEGFKKSIEKVYVEVPYEGQYTYSIPERLTEMGNEEIKGNVKIEKVLGATDYDPSIKLAGAQFTITLKNDSSQSYKTNVSGEDGICTANGIPYGRYTVSETTVPPEANKVPDFDVFIEEDGKTYPESSGGTFTVEDESKDMKISVTKEIVLNPGEATDAKVSGAYFTVYRDPGCTKQVCVIGPTDDKGYAISGKMRTGEYYLKETTFPTGIDPDAVISGENVTYRNKVYTVKSDNKAQGTETVTVPITIKNEPIRNDIVIHKEAQKTSNTPQFPIDQCEFTATLKSTKGTGSVYSVKSTAETRREDGYCIIENLPYGDYEIEETKVSPITLKCDNFDIFIKLDRKVKTTPYEPKDSTLKFEPDGVHAWVDENGKLVDISKKMQIKVRKQDYDIDLYGKNVAGSYDWTQGDAQLKGAIYQIYRYDPQTDDYTEYVYDITVDHKDSEGYWCAESDKLLVGKYSVKEKVARTEMVNGKKVEYSYAEGYLADPNTYYFEQQPDLQQVEKSYHKDVSKEKVARGSLKVIKYNGNPDGTEESPAKGAILRLTLDRDSSIYYDVTIDQYGYGEFVDSIYHNEYPDELYTIPYGKYTVTEVKESNKGEHLYIQNEDVEVAKDDGEKVARQGEIEYRIESDEPIPFHFKIVKKDKDTGATVKLTGAKFKIWDLNENEWVTQMETPSGDYIDEFEVNDQGYLYTPQELYPGKYVIYETDTPEGYYLEDDFRLPANPSDYGKVGGKTVTVLKDTLGLPEDTQYPEGGTYVGEFIYTVNMEDRPLKVILEIDKTGEMLTDSKTDSTKYGTEYTPVYTQRGLPGVTYEIRAAKDTYSPDGQLRYRENELVDTITTNEEGIAKTKEMYPGEFTIKEVVTPEGYVTDKNIPNIVLENNDKLTRVKTIKKDLSNIRQKLKLTFKKDYEDLKYSESEKEERWAVFGVYTKDDIRNVEGNVVIKRDGLVDVIRVENEEEDVTSNVDLPKGTYYVKELEASYPYELIKEAKEVTLTYKGTDDEYVTFTMDKVTNTFEKGTITLIKLSSSTLGNVVLDGDNLTVEGQDEKLAQILDDVKNMTDDEIRAYLASQDVEYVAGAEYSVYLDYECTRPLYSRNAEGKMEQTKLVTDSSGMVKLEDLPVGKYYLKETYAPAEYKMSEEVIEIELTREQRDSTVYNALVDESVHGEWIQKTDIFTGDVVPDCTFEITDKNGKVLLRSITDEDGVAYIPVDMFEDGEKYYFQEIDAPEIYDLNPEKHEFTAKIEDGKWAAEKIEVTNTRKKSKVTFEKLDVADSTRIPNCKFELRSLETDFVVEGVTDENGIYVFEDIPYGKYTYTELEAPEEYILDTEPHELVVDAEEVKVKITNEKAPELPDTGDIAVIALVAVAVVCVLGIVFVVVRNRKKATNRD